MTDASAALYEARDEAYPNEGVGIVTVDCIVYPLINQARSATRFVVNEKLVHEAQQELIGQGHIPVTFYHTHPASPPSPSARDELWLQEHPNQVMMIVGKTGIAGWVHTDRLHSLGKISKG